MPPLPNGKFGDAVQMYGSSYLQEHSLIILQFVLPSIGVGLLMLAVIIMVIIKCRLCCRDRGEKKQLTSSATGEKSAQLQNGGGKEETSKTRTRTSDSTSGLLNFSIEPTIDEVDEEAEQVGETNGMIAPIHIHM